MPSFTVPPGYFAGDAAPVQIRPAGSRRPMSLRDRWSLKDKAGVAGAGEECSAEVRELLAAAVAIDMPVYAPEGVYGFDQPMYDATLPAGDLILRGAGARRTTFEHGVDGSALIAAPTGGFSSHVAITHPVAPTDTVIEVADASAFTAGDRVHYVDTSQPVYGGSKHGVAFRVGGWWTVYRVAGNALTLYGTAGVTLTTNATLRTMAPSMGNCVFEDFAITNPTPLQQGTGSRGIVLNTVYAPEFRRVRGNYLDDDFIRCANALDGVFDWVSGEGLQDLASIEGHNFELAEAVTATSTTLKLRAVGGAPADLSVIGGQVSRQVVRVGPGLEERLASYTTINTTSKQVEGAVRDTTEAAAWPEGTLVNISFTGTPYLVMLADASWNCDVTNLRQVGGRHAVTSAVGDTANRTAPGMIRVSGAMCHGSSHAALDTHPAAQFWTFTDFVIEHCLNQSVQLRGPGHILRNGLIRGGTYGIHLPYGADDVKIENVTIIGADVALNVKASDRIRVRNLTVEDCTSNAIVAADDADWPAMVANDFADIDIRGDVEFSAMSFTLAGSAKDWQVDYSTIHAPDATSYLAGVDLFLASASTIVLPKNRHQRYFTVTGTTTVTRLEPPDLPDHMLDGLEWTLFAQSAGLTFTDGNNLKLSSVSWVSTSNESYLKLTYRAGQWFETGRRA